MEIEVFTLDGSNMSEAMRNLEALLDLQRIEPAAAAAAILHKLAKSMCDRLTTDAELAEHCHKLLTYNDPSEGKLTPDTLAERMRRIAALPNAVEVQADGAVYMATVTDPNGTGEVWCEFPLSDYTKAGLARAKLDRADTANRRPA